MTRAAPRTRVKRLFPRAYAALERGREWIPPRFDVGDDGSLSFVEPGIVPVTHRWTGRKWRRS